MTDRDDTDLDDVTPGPGACGPRAPRRRARHRTVVAVAGASVAVAAAVSAATTWAAFTDQAFLNLGTDGVSTGDYNIQVGATDAAGEFVTGEWQEADDPAGVDIAIDGANTLFPGGDPISVEIPVRNESAAFGSTLTLQLNDVGGAETDAALRDALLFTIEDGGGASGADLTYAELNATPLDLTALTAAQETTVTVTISLPSGDDDNALEGLSAYLQAQFDGSSTS